MNNKYKIYLIFLCLLFSSIISYSQIQVSSNTSSTNYATLKAAFDAINGGIHTGAISIQITGSTNETSSAQLNATGTASANYSSININCSSSASISGNFSDAVLILNGSKNIVIEGNGKLTLINSNPNGNTVSFINDANNNKISNTVIKGSTSSANRGVVYFGSGLNIGNSQNSINNCSIDGSMSAVYCIYSSGSTSTTTLENSADTITKCNIFDNRQSSGYANTSAIFLNYGSRNWVISSCSIYQTAPISSSIKGIFYGIRALPQFGSDTHQITDNFIGGNSANSSGTFSLSAASTNVLGFIGMDIETGGADNFIKNNIIKNITVTYSFNSESFQNAGIFCYLSAFNGSTNIVNNTVSDLNFINNTGLIVIEGITCTVQASNFDAATDTFNITHNTINNITGNSGGLGDVQIYGIRLNSNAAPNLNTYPVIKPVFNVSNNIVSNCSAPFAGSNTYIRGISNLNTTELFSSVTIIPTYNVTGNKISALTTNSLLANYTSGVIEGIKLSGGLGGSDITPKNVISKNEISNISGNQTGNSATSLIGIYTSNGSYLIDGNKMYGFVNKATATSVNPYIIGVHIRSSQHATTVSNNFISLGNANDNNLNIFGILNSYSTDSVNVYYNSVVIDGHGSASNRLATAALAKTSGGSDEVMTNIDSKNNLLINNRALGLANYSIFTTSPSGWTSNYNDLFSYNTSSLAYYNGIQNFSTYKTVSKQDANSINVMPTFVNETLGDLHLTGSLNIFKAGTPINNIQSDFDGKSRDPKTPFMGADEVGGVITSNNNGFIYTIFPNPVRNILHVNISSDIATTGLLTISNSVGQKVYESSPQIGLGVSSIAIDVNFLMKDVYFIKIQINGKKVTKKFVKI